MKRPEARELLETLAEETARLDDPAEWSFVGSDDAEVVAALEAQEADVETTRGVLRGALSAAEVDPVVDAYAAAVRAGLVRVRTGDAPPLPEHASTPAVEASRGTGTPHGSSRNRSGTGRPADRAERFPIAADAPGAPGTRDARATPDPDQPADDPAPPSRRLRTVVAVLVLVVVVLFGVALVSLL